jgi:hypothetical protein
LNLAFQELFLVFFAHGDEKIHSFHTNGHILNFDSFEPSHTLQEEFEGQDPSLGFDEAIQESLASNCSIHLRFIEGF